MRLAEAFSSATRDELKAALDGGSLVIYSTGRPPLPDHDVTRSGKLATFTFASPAFGAEPSGEEGDAEVAPAFAETSVEAENVGTPSFARAFTADGTVVADFSVGPGKTEIKLSEVSAMGGYPISVTAMRMPLPAEEISWDKTAFGHVYMTSGDDPRRKMSVRG
ncbi:hypothetical protein [Methyloceanibacter methanicus]|uniref:hypothetical protein n=1 Tax=Methyloceanibacter methanicus TaxID=1774968 RepID=UPI000B012EB3|nr:hypothetical protein [Methyloceanibacter methanicus]